jgi:exosortase
MPATFLILIAVPLPSAIEGTLVQRLTQTVLELAANILPVMGYPALITGSAFIVDGQLLDVAEGCSGIRSFQGCIMAALALGELRRFGLFKRLSLLVLALVTAVIANATRIIILTRLTYTEGHAAMDKAHDPIGIWTAVLTYSLIGVFAWLLGFPGRQKGRTVRRKLVNQPHHRPLS